MTSRPHLSVREVRFTVSGESARHVVIDLPDDIAQQLQTEWQDMPRHVLERVALEAYRARLPGESQIRRQIHDRYHPIGTQEIIITH